MHFDPPLYCIISSSQEIFIAGIDDDNRHQTTNVAACSDDVNLEADETRRRETAKARSAYFQSWTTIIYGVLLNLLDCGIAGLTSRRFCCRIEMVSDILATK